MKELYAIAREYYRNTSLLYHFGRSGRYALVASLICATTMVFMVFLGVSYLQNEHPAQQTFFNPLIWLFLILEGLAVIFFRFAIERANINIIDTIAKLSEKAGPQRFDIDLIKKEYLQELVKPIGSTLEDVLQKLEVIRASYRMNPFAGDEGKYMLIKGAVFAPESRPRVLTLLVFLFSVLSLAIITQYVDHEQLRRILTDILTPKNWPKFLAYTFAISLVLTIVSIPFRLLGRLFWYHLFLHRIAKESIELDYLASQLAYHAFYSGKRNYGPRPGNSYSLVARGARVLHRVVDRNRKNGANPYLDLNDDSV